MVDKAKQCFNVRIILLLFLVNILHIVTSHVHCTSLLDFISGAVAMVILGMVISHQVHHKQEAKQEKGLLIKEIKLVQRLSIETLATVAEYKDNDTAGHLKRIRKYTEVLAMGMKKESSQTKWLSKPDYIDDLVLGSLLHDIGKVVVPKKILTKPGKLTDEEYEIMKQHTTKAGELLEKASVAFLQATGKKSYLCLAQRIAMCHHERWDGKGYPYGIKGNDIPLSARIVSVVDTYDAMRSKRVYADPISHKDTMKEIIAQSGKQFDPEVVEVFQKVVKKIKEISDRNYE